MKHCKPAIPLEKNYTISTNKPNGKLPTSIIALPKKIVKDENPTPLKFEGETTTRPMSSFSHTDTFCPIDFYFVSSTSDCVDTYPIGMYPNNIIYTCTIPCDTCSGLSTNYTDFLYDFDCVPECPDDFYEFSNECIDCPTNCSSGLVCNTCPYLRLLPQQLPRRLSPCHPVITDNICTACSDADCVTCDSVD